MNCLFCKIIAGEIPATIEYQDDELIAFRDIRPQAPHHLLIVPNKHIATINEAENEDAALLGKLILTAKRLAKKHDFDEHGYRLVFNTKDHGGQEVYHIHLHLLGGRPMTWPPG